MTRCRSAARPGTVMGRIFSIVKRAGNWSSSSWGYTPFIAASLLPGLSDLVNTIKKVRANLNPALEIEGLLRTMFDPRNILAQQVSDQLQEHFGDKVYRTVIPRNVRLAEAPSFGIPVLYHDKLSKGTQAYLALAGELLNRHPDDSPAAEFPEPQIEV